MGLTPAAETGHRHQPSQALRTFRLTVAYEGTAYAGWQVQPGAATIQGVLESAAERLNGEPTRILGAGRTDAGVHARAQGARFTTRRALAAERVPNALNAYLPEDVAVRAAVAVEDEFHPIRDARAKHYRYTLRVDGQPDPFDRRTVLRVADPLDVAGMRAAAERLVGRHDFRAFEKSGSPRESTVRTLRQLDVVESGDYIHIYLVGDGFLYGMARNLAGTLLRVGRGSLAPDAISPESESVAGPSLPAHGLCLWHVDYGEPSKELR